MTNVAHSVSCGLGNNRKTKAPAGRHNNSRKLCCVARWGYFLIYFNFPTAYAVGYDYAAPPGLSAGFFDFAQGGGRSGFPLAVLRAGPSAVLRAGPSAVLRAGRCRVSGISEQFCNNTHPSIRSSKTKIFLGK